MQRVDLLQIRRALCGNAAVRVLERQNALTHRGGRNVRELAIGAAVQAPLVIEEEEHPVLLDWSSEGSAELVTDQRLARHARPIVEPVVGGKQSIAIEFVGRAVELIGAALGHKRHLPTGTASLLSPLAAYCHPELLDRIERHGESSIEATLAINS